MNKWSIGIDPGFGETGMVLIRRTISFESLENSGSVTDPRAVIDWATFSCPPNGSAFLRTEALANEVLNQISVWVNEHKIEALDIAIELPIWDRRKTNPASFSLQWRLVQAIESLTCVFETFVTEVSPGASKKLATGTSRADKDLMVKNSPFASDTDLARSTREALADAWAHSLATWGGCEACYRFEAYTKLPEVTVRRPEEK